MHRSGSDRKVPAWQDLRNRLDLPKSKPRIDLRACFMPQCDTICFATRIAQRTVDSVTFTPIDLSPTMPTNSSQHDVQNRTSRIRPSLPGTLDRSNGPHFADKASSAPALTDAKGRRERRRLIGTKRIPRPATTSQNQILWPYLVGVVFYHGVAGLALHPWFFSWSGVVVAVSGLYVFGTLGINLCYHRLLTHQGFVSPKWLERTFATLGVCCLQDTPARWVAIHRMHHQYSDEQPDPHSPLVTLFWGHVSWLFVKNSALGGSMYEHYGRDILRDGYYFWLEKRAHWVWVNFIQVLAFLGMGLGAGYLLTGEMLSAVQFASSVVIWGVFVRTVAVWHITWSVNSLAHVWGYRNYETDENSRNNWFVALISNGEGWHNNHHADQRSARHGHRWWEFDVTFLTIRGLEKLGLAKEVLHPSAKIQSATASPTGSIQ